MRFNKKFEKKNDAYDTQVANKEEALKLIEEIDKYLDYVDDGLSEYEEIKKQVKAFVPVETNKFELTEEGQRMLERKFDELQELAKSLK